MKVNIAGGDLSSAEFEKMAVDPYGDVEKAVIEGGHWEKGSAKPIVIKHPPGPASEERSHILLQCKRMLEYDLLPRDDETADRVKTLRKAVKKWLRFSGGG
jgi:hypothetical protein